MLECLLEVPAVDGRAPVFVSQDQAVAITGRSRRTVQRWIRRRSITDPAARRLLQLVAHQVLPAPFELWRVRDGGLVSPAGDFLQPQDLTWISLNVRLVRELRTRLEAAEARCRAQEAMLARSPVARLSRALLKRA